VSCFPFRLNLVLSQSGCAGREALIVASEAINGGVDLIQIREKSSEDDGFLDQIRKLINLSEKTGVPIIINDHVSAAKSLGVYGVHVGANDLSPQQVRLHWPSCQCVGFSVNSEKEALGEEADAADYLGVSAIFPSRTKTDLPRIWGLQGLRDLRTMTSKPLVAIGGIHRDNAEAVVDAGADCIAVASAISAADSPGRAAEEIRQAFLK